MPFMLKPCGHALRFSTPDGICRRCNMEVDGASSTSQDGMDSEMSGNAENIAPSAGSQELCKPFLEQVKKLVAVMVNSEGSEMMDAVTQVGRNMSTFTAGERSHSVYELVIMYCEARKEDQPKIDILLKELGKKNVLAKTHFLQSAKKLISETGDLAVDWPNIYDCTVELIGVNVSLLKSPTESLEVFGKMLNNAPDDDHARKYLSRLRHHFPAVQVADSKLTQPDSSHSAAHPRSAVGFFLSPDGAKDKFIRPVGLRSSTARPSYSREEMLKIEANHLRFSLPDGLLEQVKVVKNDTWAGERDTQLGKRQRYGSESGGAGEPIQASTKRMLENTSPPLLMSSLQRRPPGDWKYAAEKDTELSLLGSGPSHLSTGLSLTGFDRPRFPSLASDKAPAAPPTFSLSPKKSYVEPVKIIHLDRESSTKPRYNSFGAAGSSDAKSEPPRSIPPRHGAGNNGEKPSSGGQPYGLGGGKTKKFLTALNVDRMTELDTNQLSPTLCPNVKTWSRGSGSLNSFSLKPGILGSAPQKTGEATLLLGIPSRSFGMNHHNNQRASPGGAIGDHQRTPGYRQTPGGHAKSDQQSDQNWRREVFQV